MPLNIVRDNIVHSKVDAIVNAANESLSPGGGVCGSVFDVAGFEEMLAACRKIGFCETGKAVITEGFRLPSKYVIHAVGPVWHGGNDGEEALLRSCYRAALALAEAYALESIAFPLISSGSFGYPKTQALHIAVSEITQFLMQHEMNVSLVVYDRDAFRLSENLFAAVKSYIDDRYVKERRAYPHLAPGVLTGPCMERMAECMPTALPCGRALEDVVAQLDESFSESLLRLIDEKGKTDVEVYKKANIDRRLFSKIRSNKYYRPSKETAAALAIALSLSLDETKDLLGRAGFALTHASRFDIILEYYIEKKQYDVFTINETLFAFNEKLLGV